MPKKAKENIVLQDVSIDDIQSDINALVNDHITEGKKISWETNSGVSLDIDFSVPAPNIIEWSTGEKFLSQPSLFEYKRQYQTIRDLFNLRCVICNPPTRAAADCWDKGREYLESENLLVWSHKYQDDVCPCCGTTRAEFEEDKIFQRYKTFVACVGMRSGKSLMAGAYLGTYYEHRIITLGDPATYFNTFPGQPFEVAFTATTSDQAKGTIYAYYRNARAKSPWINAYVESLRAEEEKKGLDKNTLYKEVESSISYKNINVEFNSLNSNCFVEDTPVVMTDYTRKNIQDVQIGDKVLDRHGHEQTVENAWYDSTPDELLEINVQGGTTFQCTPNHKFPAYVWPKTCLCGCGEKLSRAGRLFKKGHQGNGRTIEAVVVEGSGGHIRRLPKSYNPIQDVTASELGKADYLMMPRKFDEIETTITTDKARLLGYYVAEGCSNRSRYVDGYKRLGSEFSFHSEEFDTWVTDVRNICDTYNIHYNTNFLKKAACCVTVTSGKEAILMAEWLEVNGGHHAKQKQLSSDVMHWPLPLKEELLKGMFRGDGTHYINTGSNGNTRPCISYGTASKTLAYQVQLILCQLGIYSGVVIAHRKATKFIKVDTTQYHVNVGGEQVLGFAKTIWGKDNRFKDFKYGSAIIKPLCRVEDDYIYVPINSVKTVANKKPVYNLTISNDHSYLIGGGIGTYNSGGLAGRTRIWACIDELSRFDVSTEGSKRSANEVWNVLDNSLTTVRAVVDDRKLPYYFGMMAAVSSPISYNDMTMRTVKDAKKIKEIFAIKFPTWEFNPKVSRATLEHRFKRDPIGSERDFGANPPMAESPLIVDVERFKKCIDPTLLPTASFENTMPIDGMGRAYVGKRLLTANFDTNNIHFVGGDAGKSKDSFSMVSAHGEYMDIPSQDGQASERKFVTVLDWALAIRPILKPRKTVYFDCSIDIVKGLLKKQKIQASMFDHWNSEYILQTMRNLQIDADSYQIKAEDYIQFVSDSYEGKVKLIAPDVTDEGKDPYYGMSVYGRLIHELLCLERSPDLKKVDHKLGEHNDVVCCLIMAHKMVQASAMTAGAGTGSKKANIMAGMHGISTPILTQGRSW